MGQIVGVNRSNVRLFVARACISAQGVVRLRWLMEECAQLLGGAMWNIPGKAGDALRRHPYLNFYRTGLDWLGSRAFGSRWMWPIRDGCTDRDLLRSCKPCKLWILLARFTRPCSYQTFRCKFWSDRLPNSFSLLGGQRHTKFVGNRKCGVKSVLPRGASDAGGMSMSTRR